MVEIEMATIPINHLDGVNLKEVMTQLIVMALNITLTFTLKTFKYTMSLSIVLNAMMNKVTG